MLSDNTNSFSSPVRTINARVDVYEGATLADSYTKYYALKEFTIDRVGESKFFGYGICQRFNVHLVDKDRLINITTADLFKVFLSTGGNYIDNFPKFYVTEVHRDENTNELSVTAYDSLYFAADHTVAELGLVAPYTIADVATACANLLGVGLLIDPEAELSFNLSYDGGANFDGAESVREALNAIAEATQTIYFLNGEDKLVFKRLDVAGNPVAEISREACFTLDSGENRRLATITHATELGDNVTVSTAATGSTQYVRDNPFWDLREDIDTLLSDALAAVGGLTIAQFSCEWRCNPALEIGDKIRLTAKDGSSIVSFLLDDVISYDGGLSATTGWAYEEDSAESEDNPASLGDALKKTYARVDKANKEIELVASDVSGTKEAITALQLDTEGITASVKNVEDNTSEALAAVNESISTLSNQVEVKMSAEDVQLQIQTELANGVDRVATSTGFTFNEEGLSVSKTGSEMVTTITEDGMKVYRNEEAVLVADNEGVKAEDLHATTYLIVGQFSRFEDYGERTGCFWIGG